MSTSGTSIRTPTPPLRPAEPNVRECTTASIFSNASRSAVLFISGSDGGDWSVFAVVVVVVLVVVVVVVVAPGGREDQAADASHVVLSISLRAGSYAMLWVSFQEKLVSGEGTVVGSTFK